MVNPNKKRLTVSDIRLSHSKEKNRQDRKDLWLYYVARRVSFYPTWLFLKLGISANQATYISMVIGIVGCGLLAVGNYGVRIVGASLISFWIVLDCVDGNIARFKKTFSDYGEFLDALSGYIMNVSLFLSVGISVCIYPESSFESINWFFSVNFSENVLIILSIWTSLSIIFPRLIYHKFKNTFSQFKNVEIKPEGEFLKSFYLLGYRIVHNIVSFSGFLTPLLFLATIFKYLSMFILFYALINTSLLIVTVSLITFNAWKLEKRNH